MDPERQRIQDDLRGLVDGEVRCDDVFVQMYASDASIYEIEPRAVVRPRNTTDVVATVQYARANGLPIHPRGAGTGVSGGCLGRGIVLDCSHGMRRIVRTDDTTVRVQPGVVLANLNAHLAPYGRLFGPDPAAAEVCTMGSVVAVNRGGSHWKRYGAARERTVSLQVVLSDGAVLEFGTHTLDEPATNPNEERRNILVRQIVNLLERHREAIAASTPKSLVNTSGYLLHDVWDGQHLQLAKLFAGSEGTLGIITELTLATDPSPKAVGVALLFFDRVEKATKAVDELQRFDLSACDLVDRRLLILARESDVRYDVLLPQAAEAVLLIEVEGDSLIDVREQLQQATQLITRKRRLAFDASIVVDPSDVQLYWRLAHRVLPTLYRLTGSQRPLPFVEDIAVPPAVLGEFLTTVQNTLRQYQVTASLFAHAGHGQLHLRPFLDLAKPDDVGLMTGLASDLFEEALQVGGTISGEHGNGLSRSWYVPRQFPDLYGAFRELKRLFDPDDIFNPGKITESDADQLVLDLRPVMSIPQSPEIVADEAEPPVGEPSGTDETPLSVPDIPVTEVKLFLNWDAAEIALAARSCNGCGSCRTQSESMRMCPIFRFAPAEEASPRAQSQSHAELVDAAYQSRGSGDGRAQASRGPLCQLLPVPG